MQEIGPAQNVSKSSFPYSRLADMEENEESNNGILKQEEASNGLMANFDCRFCNYLYTNHIKAIIILILFIILCKIV